MTPPDCARSLSAAAGCTTWSTTRAHTRLLRWAREAGAATIGGLDMLVAQAALQFEHWTGRTAPREVMQRRGRSVPGETRYIDETDNV